MNDLAPDDNTQVSELDASGNTDVNEIVRKYIECRDVLRAFTKRHEEKMKPLQLLQEQLAGQLREFMDQSKTQNLRTANGTCYLSTTFRASLADPDAFMKFVIASKEFDLLDRRANATAVKAYVEAHNVLPAGCNLTGTVTVGVRRKGNGKAKD